MMTETKPVTSSAARATSVADRRKLIHVKPLRPLVSASILSADFGRLAEEGRKVIDSGAEMLHLDVMDGHFVPNLTMGPDLCAAMRRHLPDAFLDVHLMIAEPAKFIAPFAKAGADHYTFHVETCESPRESAKLAEEIRKAGMTAGLAINPPTPVERILPHLEAFDMILVMSVNPGYSGQAFIGEVLSKTREIADKLRENQRLEMDGGITAETAKGCREAGCDILAAASAIFKSSDYAAAVRGLRG